MAKLIKTYESFLKFKKISESNDAGFKSSDDKLNQANAKVTKALIWININQPTYAELLVLATIYATYDLPFKTMATDGTNIMFDPDFVLEQSDEAVRFVLCHEVLHCLLEHHKRRGKRHPQGWNIACDYALNPILCGDNGEPAPGFAWPVINGKRVGLYRKDFDGLKAEDIFDLLKEENKLDQTGKATSGQQTSPDEVRDEDATQPQPAGDVLQEGAFDDVEEDESKEGKEGQDDKEGKEGQGEKEGKEKSKEDKTQRTARPGDRVRLLNGTEAVVKKAYPDGSIEI